MSCSKVLRQAMLPLGLLLGFGLLACQPLPEQPVPEASVPTESAPGESGFDPAAIEAADMAVALSGEGLQLVDPETGFTRNLPFESDMALVENTLTEIYGPPVETQANDECPAGPLTVTFWPNGLVVNAADGQFVGWNVRPQPDSTSLTTVAGIGLGSTRQELEAAYKVEMVDSSLGVEFYTGQLSGLLESTAPEAEITDFWAGTNCIFR